MNTAILAAGFVSAFITALCLTPLVARFARRKQWVDLPGGKRTVHKRPTPRAGGIAIILTFLLSTVYLVIADQFFDLPLEILSFIPSLALFIGSGIIALTGLYDDAYGLGFKKKFLFQLIVAYGMYLAGFRVEVPHFFALDADPYLQAALALPLTLLWYLGIMNAINLIDGLDGLASGISLLAFVCLAAIFALQGEALLVPLAVVMIGALLGFLVYNFNPASIFLGDTGSLFLGFMIATYALQGTIHADPLVTLVIIGLAVGYPVIDTSLAFMRRVLEGNSPFAPDKDHVHHRVLRKFNYSIRRSVFALYSIHGFLCLSAFVIAFVPVQFMILILSITFVGVGLVLKYLGYLDMQSGLVLMRERMEDLMGERVPRGNWQGSGDGAVSPLLEPMPAPSKKLRPETEEDRELVVHSAD